MSNILVASEPGTAQPVLGGQDACNGDVAVARRVIRAEISGLESRAQRLDEAFAAAVALCAAAHGRIVVTGVGKSGHVGRKIAATLASTGTPAQFVHAGEASHGDLGMIGADDAVVALSNSGESADFTDIIAYSRRFQIPLIAVTGGRESTLAAAADAVLLLPLGDALAIALLERRDFSSADFRVFHPGGRLGRRLLRVSDIMHGISEVPLVSPATPMSEAILVMTARSFGCVGACDGEGRLIGVVTDGDLRRHMGASLLGRAVAEIMHRSPKTIGAAALAAEALGLMNRNAITSLFVVDGEGHPTGFLHMHDCLRTGVA